MESNESLDEANVNSYEVWWGDGTDTKTKWVTTYSCNFLNNSGDYWSSIMQGVHLVMGFGSVMYIVSDEGDYYGDKLREGAKVKDAFFEGNRLYQPTNSTPTICRVLGADISKDDTISSYSRKPAPIGGNDTYYYWTITVQPKAQP